MDTLNQSGAAPDVLQMVDSTLVRAHHQAAGAKGGLLDRVLAAQEQPQWLARPPVLPLLEA